MFIILLVNRWPKVSPPEVNKRIVVVQADAVDDVVPVVAGNEIAVTTSAGTAAFDAEGERLWYREE